MFSHERAAAKRASATYDENPAYRLQVYSKTPPQLPVGQDWTVEYQFAVPPLPISPTWNYKVGTVYQWGDVDFDGYGSAGPYRLSEYRFNQIVPQLILGSVLDSNDANYKPAWSQRSSWAIQAQYYWYNAKTSTSYAQTGNIVSVHPGDEIATAIRYEERTGTVTASIADKSTPGPTGVSSIAIARPFPNEPSLFRSWKEFFTKAAVASKTTYVLSTPAADVETDFLDEQTICGLLPFKLSRISMPGVVSAPSSFGTQQMNGFRCAQPVVSFEF